MEINTNSVELVTKPVEKKKNKKDLDCAMKLAGLKEEKKDGEQRDE